LANHAPWDDALAAEIVGRKRGVPGALLPMLHDLQHAFGYIDERSYPLLMDACQLSRAEVVGVVHFYHDFRIEPPGEHTLKLCRAEACQSMGSEALAAHIIGRIGAAPGETSPDGRVTHDSVYCLGNCALSPALMLDGRLFGRVTAERADRILAGAGL
jgi:formate dehydrogenase subunit gamma